MLSEGGNDMEMKEYKDTKEFKDFQKAVDTAKANGNDKQLTTIRNQLKKVTVICGAIQKNGKICTRAPHTKDDGSSNGRCAFHGGKSTGQTTKEGKARSLANLSPQANMIHGAYSERFQENLTQEEIELYTYLMNYFENDLEIKDPINLILCQRFVMNLLKQMRIESDDLTKESRSYNDFDAKIVRFIETLGLNKRFMDSKDHKDNKESTNLNMLFDFGSNE